MELVTGTIGRLLPKLGELLKKEYGLQKVVKEKIVSLSRELEVAHVVLRKIGDVPPDQLDELVRLWSRDLREASYDMEDIVDTFFVRVDAPDPTEPYMLRRLLKKVGNLFKKSKARRKISTLIQDINNKVKEVEARHGRYTLHNITHRVVAAATIDPRLVNLYKRAAELIGIERPKDDLINMLSLGVDNDVSDKQMKIVSVVGPGGLGKTTLVKAVYDQLNSCFECAAFVPVGRNPDVKKVFRDILIGLNKRNYMNLNVMALDERQLMDELKEFVKEKRCFIIIDDIWDKEPWKLIRCALQECHCGSRLVITTRICEVATYVGKAYRIQPLSRENSEKLLYARVVNGEGKYFDSPSTVTCDKILKKCGGVPLAIITIASLLANKSSSDWSQVYNSIGFGHEDNDDVENTRRILSFSYYDLPSHLKACLLYLSLFREDELIEKNGLIWKWVSEGFIIIPEEQAAAGIGLFELGERYFYDLINRSLIQPEETEDNGYIDACSVHDMVLDLIHSLSRNENFFTVLDGDERQKLPGSIARRLAMQKILPNSDQLANIAVEKVRSLIASHREFRALCPCLTVLRLLDIVDCRAEKDCNNKCMLDDIGSLLHLRYLRLEDQYITELPREVRYLRFLQTLDFWGTRIQELPEELGLLTKLVCLRAYSGTRIPAGVISKLTSLQELRAEPRPVATVQFVKELGLLRELRVLRTDIGFISESMEKALQESLGNLHDIRELRIKGFLSVYNGGTSDAGFISCRCLRFMHLKCFLFTRLPAWIKSSLAPNLSYLAVRVLVVKEQDMETLARLPELRCLKLYSDDTKLVYIKISTGVIGYFQKLRILWIVGTSIWFDLHGSDSSRVVSTIMPCLESLEFEVDVRSLIDTTQLAFDKLIGFENVGRTSLHRVTTYVYCGGSRASEVDEVEAVLANAAAVHPNHPTLRTEWREEVLSPYQEVRAVHDAQ